MSSKPAEGRLYRGSCHCAVLSVTFETRRPLMPRACQCSFCRKHGASMVSDPEGRATIRFEVPLAEATYRFASQEADYILCPRCGTYMGAVIRTDDGPLATLNLNAFDDVPHQPPAKPVSYEGQSSAQKRQRRIELWTPVSLSTEPPHEQSA